MKQQITVIGLDLAKSVFQVHGIGEDGEVVVRRKLSRSRVLDNSANWGLVWLAWKPAQRPTIGPERSVLWVTR